MNAAIWMPAGAALGWLGFSYWGFNEKRGPMVSCIIGAAGGLFGGKMVAPMFLEAAAAAATFLFVGNLVHDRWGV